jgi:hypothetical protein
MEKHLSYSSLIDDSVSNFYKNNRLFIYDLGTKTSLEIAKDIDENKSVLDWNNQGCSYVHLKKRKLNFTM